MKVLSGSCFGGFLLSHLVLWVQRNCRSSVVGGSISCLALSWASSWCKQLELRVVRAAVWGKTNLARAAILLLRETQVGGG